MENMEKTTSPSKNDGRRTKAIDENSDSISKINMEEKFIKKMNYDICEITERVTEVSKRYFREFVLGRLVNNRRCRAHAYRVERIEELLRDLYMALDELNFMSIKAANGGWFVEKLDKNSLNYLKLHGSKSMAEEKKILRDIKIEHEEKNDASFKSLEVLKKSREIYYLKDRMKLMKEIEQFQVQLMERAFKENISNYESLKKTIKDQIKLSLCDMIESESKVKYGLKELDVINGEIFSLRAKLIEKYNKKDEAYQRILKLKKNCNE